MDISPKCIDGKKLALLAIGKDKSGDDDWSVFTGTVSWDGKNMMLIRQGEETVDIPLDWFGRAKEVSTDMKEVLLDSDYFISLNIDFLPDGEDISSYIFTGLKL